MLMHAGSPPVSPPRMGRLRRASAFLIEALRVMTWRHAGWTALLGLLSTVVMMTVSHAIGVFLFRSWDGRLRMLGQDLAILEVAAFVFLCCILVADQAVRRGASRIRTYVVAVLAASVLFAALDTAIRFYLTDFFEGAAPYWKPVHSMSTLMWTLVLGGFATFVYADLKRNRESTARLQAAALRRTQAARDVLQTRLQAMQARVEPQFLFDTLDRIGEIYERDAAGGQRTIDELIVYLRTAMPHIGSSHSTLAREIDLVRA
jgi:sensor histidine kinase YesM